MARAEGRNSVQAWRFTATSTVEDGETVLKVEGRLGHHGATLLRKAGERILEHGDPIQLLGTYDLTGSPDDLSAPDCTLS